MPREPLLKCSAYPLLGAWTLLRVATLTMLSPCSAGIIATMLMIMPCSYHELQAPCGAGIMSTIMFAQTSTALPWDPVHSPDSRKQCACG